MLNTPDNRSRTKSRYWIYKIFGLYQMPVLDTDTYEGFLELAASARCPETAATHLTHANDIYRAYKSDLRKWRTIRSLEKLDREYKERSSNGS